MEYKNLTEIKKGQAVKVVEINGGQQFQKKIDAIGLRVGSQIVKLSSQLLNGPVTIKIGSTKLAIGRGMARKIFVDGNNA
jgi:ferrous iron transport protein A